MNYEEAFLRVPRVIDRRGGLMKASLVALLGLMVVVIAAINYVRKTGSEREISAVGARGRSADENGLSSRYVCGRFGNWIYRFPTALTGPLIQYVGDDPWIGDIGNKERGCEDRIEGLIFRSCLPSFILSNFDYKENESCSVRVRIFRGEGDGFIRTMVSSNRNRSLYPGRLDGHDTALGLYYFDVKTIFVRRLFWRPASAGRPAVFGSCSVDAAFPQCNFIMFSRPLDAGMSVSFDMTQILRWEEFLHRVEGQLKNYRNQRVGGSGT